MREIIKVSDISYKVKNRTIIDHISLSVEESDTFALLGENGSGKSTLIDLILNDLKLSSGYVTLFGTQKRSFKNVGIVYDHLPLFPLLKVREVIRYFSSLHKLEYHHIKREYFEIFEIDKIANSLIKDLSQGECKRISLLLAVIHKPALLILDEPFANLDPTIIDRIWKILKQDNRTIFLTTHHWKDIEKMASRVAFIYNGSFIKAPQSPDDIIKGLPSEKKITISSTLNTNNKLNALDHYKHNEEWHIFFDKDQDVLIRIREITDNFSVQDVSLKDAYLYYTRGTKEIS